MMGTHGLKSDTKHPYQKSKFPFWRYVSKGFYSEKTIEEFEQKKLEYDVKARYVNWVTR